MGIRSSRFGKAFIGPKVFYAGVIALIIPMIVQQGITSFVNLLDNVMVGRLGTEEMSAVAIVNQIVFVFNLTVFGGVAGASIFGAQFYGKGDTNGVRNAFRFKIWLAVIISVIGIAAFLLFGETLVSFFLNEAEGDQSNITETMGFAKEYLTITLWGLLPFALSQCYASTLKDTGETVVPMTASVIAILANLVLNYLLIFGSFGFPKMGVAGAALATTISRYAELGYIAIVTHRRHYKFKFIVGAFKSLKVPGLLVKRILKTGTPLLLNETLWAVGTSMIVQAYSLRGLSAVAAININNTVWNVFSIIMMAMGNAIGIMVGQQLGANDIDEAKVTVRRLLFFDVVVNLVIGGLIIATSPLVPLIYNTEEIVRHTAMQLLVVSGFVLPIDAYVHGAYFTIRSGGKTVVTFLFDCVFTWVVSLPVAFVLANFTDMPLVWMFLCVQLVNLIKVVIGTLMIRSGIWAKNVVSDLSSPDPVAADAGA